MRQWQLDMQEAILDGQPLKVGKWKPEPCEKHPPVYLGCPHCRIERQESLLDKFMALVNKLLEDKERLEAELHAANNRTMQAVKDGEGVSI